MLLFDDDLAVRQATHARFLQAQARLGLGQKAARAGSCEACSSAIRTMPWPPTCWRPRAPNRGSKEPQQSPPEGKSVAAADVIERRFCRGGSWSPARIRGDCADRRARAAMRPAPPLPLGESPHARNPSCIHLRNGYNDGSGPGRRSHFRATTRDVAGRRGDWERNREENPMSASTRARKVSVRLGPGCLLLAGACAAVWLGLSLASIGWAAELPARPTLSAADLVQEARGGERRPQPGLRPLVARRAGPLARSARGPLVGRTGFPGVGEWVTVDDASKVLATDKNYQEYLGVRPDVCRHRAGPVATRPMVQPTAIEGAGPGPLHPGHPA